MNGENPYSAPLSDTPPARRKRVSVGPVMSGLLAIIAATVLLGGYGLLASILGVGSWWVYKLWPRKSTSEDVRARTYLEQLERSPIAEADNVKSVDSEAPGQSIDALRDLRL